MQYIITLMMMLLACLISCKSFDPAILTNTRNVDGAVKPMRVIVNYDSIYKHNDNKIEGLKELNVVEIAGVIKNSLHFDNAAGTTTLSIIINKIDCSYSYFGGFLNFVSLGTLALLGVPGESYTYTVYLSAAIMDSSGKILKTYEVKGTDTEHTAMYYGYDSSRAASLTAFYTSIGFACDQLREQLKNDEHKINGLLK